MILPPYNFDWPPNCRPFRDSDWIARRALGEFQTELAGDVSPSIDFEQELKREVCAGHPLHGKTCLAVATTTDHPDDFIVAVDDAEFPVAYVHLTWAVERTPDFPFTTRYKSWDDFRRTWLSLTTG